MRSDFRHLPSVGVTNMASILTSPPAIEPVSLDQAKVHLRIRSSDDDEVISSLIVAARRYSEAKTGLALIQQGWSQFLDQWPEDGIVELAAQPLMSVESVKVYGDDDVPAIVDGSLYFVDKISRPSRLLPRNGGCWPIPSRNGNGIEIAFTAGFGENAGDVPEDLREALLQLVAHWFENRGTGREPELPLTVETILARYRELKL